VSGRAHDPRSAVRLLLVVQRPGPRRCSPVGRVRLGDPPVHLRGRAPGTGVFLQL